MALATIRIDATDLTATSLARILPALAASPRPSLRKIADFLRGFAGGVYRGSIRVRTGAVQAVATMTLTGDPVATETFVLCGTTFTARASGAVGNEFNISAGNVTLTAASIVAFVNASATAKVTGSVIASSVAGVVTFTARDPGAQGNGLVLTESLSNTTRVDFAGGSDGTQTDLALG